MNRSTKYIHFLFVFAVLATLSMCGDSNDSSVTDQDAVDKTAIENYIAENDSLAVAHESGIYYNILDTVATGTPVSSGDILSIYYVAKVMGGDGYDQIVRDVHDSVKLKHGVDAVLPIGLDTGVGLMKVGETFRFYIPSILAYRDYSWSSTIPENAIIEIEVELAAIQNEGDILTEQLAIIDQYIIDNNLNDTIANPKDSIEYLAAEQIYYKRKSEGTENDTLRTNDFATISYTGSTLDGEVFDRRPNATPLTYTFGIGTVIEGLDAGVSAMERGENALIILPSHKAYGESVLLVVPQADKQEFVERQEVPQYATKIEPYQILIFDTSLLNNP